MGPDGLCLKAGRGLGDGDASSAMWDAAMRDVGRGKVTSGM